LEKQGSNQRAPNFPKFGIINAMSYLSEEKIKDLEIKANNIRKSVIEMLIEAGSGHTAGPLGMADIFTLFYFHI